MYSRFLCAVVVVVVAVAVADLGGVYVLYVSPSMHNNVMTS